RLPPPADRSRRSAREAGPQGGSQSGVPARGGDDGQRARARRAAGEDGRLRTQGRLSLVRVHGSSARRTGADVQCVDERARLCRGPKATLPATDQLSSPLLLLGARAAVLARGAPLAELDDEEQVLRVTRRAQARAGSQQWLRRLNDRRVASG